MLNRVSVHDRHQMSGRGIGAGQRCAPLAALMATIAAAQSRSSIAFLSSRHQSFILVFMRFGTDRGVQRTVQRSRRISAISPDDREAARRVVVSLNKMAEFYLRRGGPREGRINPPL